MSVELCFLYSKKGSSAEQDTLWLQNFFKNKGFTVVDQPSSATKLCFCLGGDGSLLSCIRTLGELRFQIPLCGIHSSPGLGFLHVLKFPSEEKREEWAGTLARLVSEKNFKLNQRWGIVGKLRSVDQSFWALNDLVCSKGRLARMISLRLWVNGNILFEKIRGDGLIISSALGSTAYSLSAGGPVVDPTLPVLIVTPISPHQIAQRPLILSSEAKLEIEILEGGNCYLTEDGQNEYALNEGDRICIEQAPQALQWWIPEGDLITQKNYYEELRHKLGFGRN